MKNYKSKSLVVFTTFGMSISLLLAGGCGNNPAINDPAKQKPADAAQQKVDAQKKAFSDALLGVGYDFKKEDKSFVFSMSMLIDNKAVDSADLVGTLANGPANEKDREKRAHLAAADKKDVEYTAVVTCSDLVKDPDCDSSTIDVTKATGALAGTVQIQHRALLLGDTRVTVGSTASTSKAVAQVQDAYSKSGLPAAPVVTTTTATGTGTSTGTETGTMISISTSATGTPTTASTSTSTEGAATFTTETTGAFDKLQQKDEKQLFQVETVFTGSDPKDPILKATFMGTVGKAGKVLVLLQSNGKDAQGNSIADVSDTVIADASYDSVKNLITITIGSDLTIVAQPSAPEAKK